MNKVVTVKNNWESLEWFVDDKPTNNIKRIQIYNPKNKISCGYTVKKYQRYATYTDHSYQGCSISTDYFVKISDGFLDINKSLYELMEENKRFKVTLEK
jgi:hypothetical protein